MFYGCPTRKCRSSLMISKEIRQCYSCKRKSDFVTYFAIIFFFMIVGFELYLIFWVPIQLQREGVLQKHVAKEQMLNLTDNLRRQVRKVPVQTPLNKGEVALAGDVLDVYANYLRKNQDIMDLSDILEVTKMLRLYSLEIYSWNNKKFAFRREEISLTKAMELIEKNNSL